MMLFAMMLAELDDDDRDFVFQLWEEYGDYMYSTAYDILGSREDAEDAVQEIVLKIMDNLTKFTDRDPDSVRNQIVIYVRCITKNTAIDAYRKNKRRAVHLAEDAETVREVPDFASLPDELVLTHRFVGRRGKDGKFQTHSLHQFPPARRGRSKNYPHIFSFIQHRAGTDRASSRPAQSSPRRGRLPARRRSPRRSPW